MNVLNFFKWYKSGVGKLWPVGQISPVVCFYIDGKLRTDFAFYNGYTKWLYKYPHNIVKFVSWPIKSKIFTFWLIKNFFFTYSVLKHFLHSCLYTIHLTNIYLIPYIVQGTWLS